MSQAISVCLDGIRRREAKVSEIGGKDGLRPLPTLYTAIADINRFRFKRNMPEHMVLSPDLFKFKSSIIRGFGEIGALKRRMKLTAGPHNSSQHILPGAS